MSVPPGPSTPNWTRGRFRSLAAPVIAAAGAGLPFVAILAAGFTLQWRDTPRVHAPLRGLIVEALRDFRLPLWNPYEACGAPLFAQLVHGVLHPVSVLAAALAPGASLDVLIVAHVLLAAAGAALLARTLGVSPAAATAAGLGYGLCGYVASMAAVLHYAAAAGAAPWAMAGLLSAARGGRLVAAGAAGVACLHFAGDPQWALVAAALGLALAADAAGIRGLLRSAAAVALGTAVAAVQLAPAWALLGRTIRGTTALTDAERVLWALSPWRIVEFVAPGFFTGRPGLLVAPVFVRLGGAPHAPGALLPMQTLPFVASVFVGAVIVALAFAGMRGSRTGRLLGAAALILLWLALGANLGAEQALGGLPIWGSFRYAEKLVGPLALVLALAAALGLDRVAAAPSRRFRAVAGACTAAFGASAVLLAAGPGVDVLARLGAADAAPAAAAQLARGFGQAAGALALLVALLWLGARRAAWRRALPCALAALVFIEALGALPLGVHLGQPGMRETAPLSALRGSADVVRVATPLRGVSRWKPERLDSVDGMLAVESRLGVTPYPASGGFDQVETYTALFPRRATLVDNILGWDRDPRFWQLRRRYSLTHVVVRDTLSQREQERAAIATDNGRLVLDDREWRFRVFAVPHRPWASFAQSVVVAKDLDDAQRALAAVAAQSWDTVVVEGPAPADPAAGRVISIARSPESIRIEAEAEGDALLVVNDAFWPGWKAWIDGRPAPILCADVMVRAVNWPPGRHVLEMRYAPRELAVGAWITIAGLLVTALIVAAPGRNRGIPRGQAAPC